MTSLGFLISACPDCPVGRDARALVWADGFWVHAGYALLPFLVVLLLVRLIAGYLERGG